MILKDLLLTDKACNDLYSPVNEKYFIFCAKGWLRRVSNENRRPKMACNVSQSQRRLANDSKRHETDRRTLQ